MKRKKEGYREPQCLSRNTSSSPNPFEVPKSTVDYSNNLSTTSNSIQSGSNLAPSSLLLPSRPKATVQYGNLKLPPVATQNKPTPHHNHVHPLTPNAPNPKVRKRGREVLGGGIFPPFFLP